MRPGLADKPPALSRNTPGQGASLRCAQPPAPGNCWPPAPRLRPPRPAWALTQPPPSGVTLRGLRGRRPLRRPRLFGGLGSAPGVPSARLRYAGSPWATPQGPGGCAPRPGRSRPGGYGRLAAAFTPRPPGEGTGISLAAASDSSSATHSFFQAKITYRQRKVEKVHNFSRFHDNFSRFSADEKAVLRKACLAGDISLDLLERLAQARQRTQSRGESDARTDAGRRVLVGARLPRPTAERYKLAAKLKGVSLYRFACEALEREYQRLQKGGDYDILG